MFVDQKVGKNVGDKKSRVKKEAKEKRHCLGLLQEGDGKIHLFKRV